MSSGSHIPLLLGFPSNLVPCFTPESLPFQVKCPFKEGRTHVNQVSNPLHTSSLLRTLRWGLQTAPFIGEKTETGRGNHWSGPQPYEAGSTLLCCPLYIGTHSPAGQGEMFVQAKPGQAWGGSLAWRRTVPQGHQRKPAPGCLQLLSCGLQLHLDLEVCRGASCGE